MQQLPQKPGYLHQIVFHFIWTFYSPSLICCSFYAPHKTSRVCLLFLFCVLRGPLEPRQELRGVSGDLENGIAALKTSLLKSHSSNLPEQGHCSLTSYVCSKQAAYKSYLPKLGKCGHVGTFSLSFFQHSCQMGGNKSNCAELNNFFGH